ncbi:nucleotidyltransferase domain-containing protein [Arsukibacterium sp. UBA3155]|uniref:nucleotidyltransferase domain-containing protein n=1 Tax=Arsukibacterium sp. UBA3155 TaxID=1946058 RepID=UPI0025C5923E|nr:nucleotidyltransferase [Arsukibacterium sp. UBA3155]|tara:strand:+ start:131190 stop:132437 length:1248 start_codon:yes stop_codon:yes gene_type:complete
MTTLFTNARALSEHKKSMLVEMLDSVFDNLDLNKTQRERIETAYKAVGNYLASCDHPLLKDVQIYPQGSMRLRTTNKPLSQEEFDVDLILFLPHASYATRDEIVEVVKQHLLDKDVYKDLVEDLPRGLRINYKGDYHLDITPAKEYNLPSLQGHPLWIVDKHTGFKESNPEGMAQGFDEACSMLPVIRRRHVFLEALNKSVTELPDQSKKKPLNRIIQILKRHRDVWSQQDGNLHADFRPISVIITMLASLAYVEVVKSGKEYDNEFDLILDVIELMPLHIESNFDEILITNPTMRPENYAEKWNRVERLEGQKYRKAFYTWHQAAVDTFERLAGANNQGMDNVFAALSGAFGQRPVLAAKDQIIKAVNANRDNGNLSVALGTGAITAAIAGKTHAASRVVTPVVPVKRNQFYGD